MAAGDKSAESFASLYLSGKKGVGRRPRVARQADLFGEDSSPSGGSAVAEALQRAASPIEAAATLVDVRRVWTVRELVGEIRQQVERLHVSVWVEGEISNCRPAPSGHFYFTLKDGEAQLPVVMFRRQAMLLAVRPKDGDAVEVRGRVSVYESRGQLQLIAETLELRGAGALELAFKRLKARLQAEGLFAEERKRPLPAFPRCVGVVTSPSGAVIRDMANVVRRRHARLNLLVYPAAMQGAHCALTVAEGIRFFNRQPGLVDAIVLARGGGSIEDLAGFNDEGLARAIAASELPVVSAVGHETDFTIADFVADLRAPTPSAAAELVTAAQHRIEERVAELAQRVGRAGRYQVMLARQRYMRLAAEQVLARLRDAVSRRDQRLDELRMRLEAAAGRRDGAARAASGRARGSAAAAGPVGAACGSGGTAGAGDSRVGAGADGDDRRAVGAAGAYDGTAGCVVAAGGARPRICAGVYGRRSADAGGGAGAGGRGNSGPAGQGDCGGARGGGARGVRGSRLRNRQQQLQQQIPFGNDSQKQGQQQEQRQGRHGMIEG